jgi:hypothetical protein
VAHLLLLNTLWSLVGVVVGAGMAVEVVAVQVDCGQRLVLPWLLALN